MSRNACAARFFSTGRSECVALSASYTVSLTVWSWGSSPSSTSCPDLSKLRSYEAAKSEILPGVEHRQHRYWNKRAENSHQLIQG